MVTVQRARVEEVPEIKQVLTETWVDTYGTFLSQDTIQKVTTVWHDPQLLASQVEDPEVFFGVAKDEGNTILGLVTVRRLGDDAAAMSRLYVSPQYQRKGIGSRLLQASMVAFPGTRRLLLEVEEQNQKGLSFCRKQGFQEISRKEETVEGETLKVVEMERQLS